MTTGRDTEAHHKFQVQISPSLEDYFRIGHSRGNMSMVQPKAAEATKSRMADVQHWKNKCRLLEEELVRHDQGVLMDDTVKHMQKRIDALEAEVKKLRSMPEPQRWVPQRIDGETGVDGMDLP